MSSDVKLEVVLEAKDHVRDPGLVDTVVRALVTRAFADAQSGGPITVTTRDVQRAGDHRGATGAWVEVVIQEPGSGDAHARGRAAAPLLVSREGEVPLLDVSRTPGKGTRVRLLLPAVALARSPSVGPVVLLAEDDTLVRDALGDALRHRGYRVVAAANGQAALESFESLGAPVDILVTDVMMPRMSGIELARRLVSRQPGVKVLFLSGLPLPRGAVLPGPFVSKPLDLNVLLEQLPPLIEGMLGRSSLAPPVQI